MTIDYYFWKWDLARKWKRWKYCLIFTSIALFVLLVVLILLHIILLSKTAEEKKNLPKRETKILLIGGFAGMENILSEVEVYIPTNLSDNHFLNSRLITPRDDHVGDRIGECIYIAGGHDKAYSTLDTTEILCENDTAWKQGPEMIFGRGNAVAGVIQGFLLACGGKNRTDMHDTCEYLDVTHLKWHILGSRMPGHRHASAAAVLEDRYFFNIGGLDLFRDLQDTVFRLDWKTQNWDTVAELPKPVAYAEATVLHEVLYVCGGKGEKARTVSECAKFENGNWTQVAELNIGRAAGSFVAFDKYIYAFAGNGWQGSSVEFFDPELNFWNLSGPLLQGKALFTAVVV